jgi:NADH-quinone oxidoreductase subunit L
MPHLLLNWFSLLAQAEGEHGATAAAPEYLFLNFVWVIPALPLLAFIINGLFGRRLGKTAGWIATILVGLSFLVAVGVLVDVTSQVNAHAAPFQYNLYTWILSGDFKVPITFLVDPLTAVMLMVVLSVGTLVHLYSNGYMEDDPDIARFFTYLPLFIFSMLILVLANNLVLLFVGWEAVGLCSYLLIGFWYTKKTASDAAKKAFIVNRIGDFGFALGIMLLFVNFFMIAPGVEYLNLFEAAEREPMFLGNMTIACLLLFAGAIGKSAQFPLHVWLPDAMEGPTPVSALIHAATMVTAGVYMVARLNPLFSLAPDALLVVTIIGTTTALLGATIALVQNDIKRVVAYSTVSQLGYMFVALGIGAWSSSIFHLMTHAFFKGLLFLGAGAVIHAMHHAGVHDSNASQDIRNMGQLRRRLPVTFWTFMIGAAANAGVFPLAGFWSKDEIIGNAFLRGNWVAGALLTVGSFLTALYMFRLVFVVFFGKDNVPREAAREMDTHRIEPHMPLIIVPLIILAIPAALIGFLGVPPDAGIFHNFIHGVFTPAIERGVEVPPGFTQPTLLIMLISTFVAIGGIFTAFLLYYRPNPLPGVLATNLAWLYNGLLHKWYFDEFYQRIFVDGGKAVAYALWRFDQKVVDGAVNGVAGLVRGTGSRLRTLQSGFVQGYALVIGLGVLALVTYLFIVLPKG